MGYLCISITGNTKYFDQIFRSSFSGLTKREKGSHKKLEEEAQNEKLTEMLIMKLEQRHLREKPKNSRKRAKALPPARNRYILEKRGSRALVLK